MDETKEVDLVLDVMDNEWMDSLQSSPYKDLNELEQLDMEREYETFNQLRK